MSVLEAKRGLSHPQGCCSRQPPGRLGELRACWSPHRPHASPSGRSLPSEGASVAQLLLPPVLPLVCPLKTSARALCPPPDSSQGPQGSSGPSPSGREPASQLRAQRCPVPHADLSSGLPSGVFPWKPLLPSALLPPRSSSRGPSPALRPPAGPSPQQEKKVSTRTGRRPQLPFYFSRVR